MPSPPKTSDEAVVAAARRIVDKAGPDALSMLAVATAVGVRPASLYRRFENREALLDAVAAGALDDLRAALASSMDLPAMARAYRGWARRHPGLYALIYTGRAEKAELMARRAAAVAPVLDALAPFVPEEDRLAAARVLTAYLHGHVTMELQGAFKLGGDVDRAFDYGVVVITRALGSTSPRAVGQPRKRGQTLPGKPWHPI